MQTAPGRDGLLPYDAGRAASGLGGGDRDRPPQAWPDRPLLVAIGDGVSTALRSAEVSRLATRTAWQRTFFHLHAPVQRGPAGATRPLGSAPRGWLAPARPETAFWCRP